MSTRQVFRAALVCGAFGSKKLNSGRRQRRAPHNSFRYQLIALLLISAILLTGTVSAKNRPAAKPPAPKSNAPNAASLFDKLANFAVKYAGVNPDQIEISRYAIKHPDHFLVVTDHAAAQDYPFFVLIGAAKVARTKVISGQPTLTQQQCTFPIDAINNIFAKADQTADSLGKKESGMVAEVARNFAAEYAKEASNQAKQQLIEEISYRIPYFGELPTICSFAFETNLKLERDIQNQITETVKKLVTAHNSFANGNYVGGVTTLIELTKNPDIACEFVDQSVSGGVIGRTPILGTLARGVCKSFSGTVFDAATGLIKGGIGLVEDGVQIAASFGKSLGCAVYSLFGNGCSSAPKPPPDPTIQAQQYAAAHCGMMKTGVKDFKSDLQLNSYSYTCTNGTECRLFAGKVSCMTASEKAAWSAQRAAMLQADMKNKFPADLNAIYKETLLRCPYKDKQCQLEVAAALDKATNRIRDLVAAYPTGEYPSISNEPLTLARFFATQAVHEAEFRVLPSKWAEAFYNYWKPRCASNKKCLDTMNLALTSTPQTIAYKHKYDPPKSYASMSPIFAGVEIEMLKYYNNVVVGTLEIRSLIDPAVMDARGREPNLFELVKYKQMLQAGKTANDIYLDAVTMMNKSPAERAEMINLAYRTAMGKAANPGELQYWQQRKESYKELVAAAREYLYTPAGAKDLKETMIRAYQARYPGRPVPLIIPMNADYARRKAIYVEMLR